MRRRPIIAVVVGLVLLAVIGLSVRTPRTGPNPADGLPWLSVSGNRIVTAQTGQDVVLRGANVLRSEWDLRMDAERRAIPALASWKGNVIVRGFASDPVNAGNAAYLAMLDEHVTLAAAHRMYVVFAWRSHTINGPQPTMPDDRAQQALAALAKRYSTRSNVMYALQVEPHDVTWAQVQPRFVQMVDAIRAAASPSKPIVMVPGVAWGRDVSGALTLPVNRDNIVYKTHPYNSASLFQQQFLNTYQAGKAVFIGEFGYLPEHGMHMPDVQALIDTARTHRLGWAAWAFDYQGGPNIVADNVTFAPSSPYGVAVQAAMVSTPPVPSELAPPGVRITNPLPSTSVSGIVPVSLDLVAPAGVAKIELSIDGSTVATTTTAPFAYNWDSTRVSNGGHTLTARLTDGLGRAATASATVTVANAVLIPVPSTSTVTSVNDSSFRYSGTWNNALGTSKYMSADRSSSTSGNYYTVPFTGTQVKLLTTKSPEHGKAAVRVDDGPEVLVDLYSPTFAAQALVYESPVLPSVPHLLHVRVTGSKNALSQGTRVSADRADIRTVPTASVNDNTTGLDLRQFSYSGAWSYASGSTGKYATDDHFADQAGATARLRFNGTRAHLYGSTAGWHGTALVSIDGGPQTPLDYYSSARRDGVLLYSSKQLAAGNHELVITVGAGRNPAATGNVITVDRVVVEG